MMSTVTGPSSIDICLKLYLPPEQVPTCCSSRWSLSRTHFKVRALSPLKRVFHLLNVSKSLFVLVLALTNSEGSWKKD